MRNLQRIMGAARIHWPKMDTWLVKKTPDRYEVKIPSRYFTIMWISCAGVSIKA